jgi:hypothetical protein
MELYSRKAFAQLRPFRHGFLHSILAEDPVARLQNWNDGVGAESLAHRDKRYGACRSSGVAFRCSDALAHLFEVVKSHGGLRVVAPLAGLGKD